MRVQVCFQTPTVHDITTSSSSRVLSSRGSTPVSRATHTTAQFSRRNLIVTTHISAPRRRQDHPITRVPPPPPSFDDRASPQSRFASSWGALAASPGASGFWLPPRLSLIASLFPTPLMSSSALLESPVACRFLSRPSWCPRYSLDNLDTSLSLAALVSPSGSAHLLIPQSFRSPLVGLPVLPHPSLSVPTEPSAPHPRPPPLTVPPSLPVLSPILRVPSQFPWVSQSPVPSSHSPCRRPRAS